MAKNVFKYLNTDDAIRVDILHVQYGKINLWNDPVPYKCLWLIFLGSL